MLGRALPATPFLGDRAAPVVNFPAFVGGFDGSERARGSRDTDAIDLRAPPLLEC